jgi:hypothetical protein
MNTKKTYTNPRTTARIESWPMGSGRRGVATFSIEHHPKRGERGVRQTVDHNGKKGAPKFLTYARKARIVDGSDGKTYIAQLTLPGFITIVRGDMRYDEEVIHSDDSRYSNALALFEGAA